MGREMLGVRLSEEGAGLISDLAERYGSTKSTVIRVMLGETLRNKSVMSTVENRLEAMRERL